MRCSPGWRIGYSSTPMYFFASASMFASAPSVVGARRGRGSRGTRRGSPCSARSASRADRVRGCSARRVPRRCSARQDRPRRRPTPARRGPTRRGGGWRRAEVLPLQQLLAAALDRCAHRASLLLVCGGLPHHDRPFCRWRSCARAVVTPLRAGRGDRAERNEFAVVELEAHGRLAAAGAGA